MKLSIPLTRVAPGILVCTLLSLMNELAAQNTGDPSTNSGFGDMMIGEGRNPQDWAGETKLNRRGAGQGITVDVRARSLTTFHFGSGNGDLYPYVLRVTSQVKRERKLKAQIRHLNSPSGGNSKNVTGAMRRGDYSTEVAPGKTAVFKVGLRYRMDDSQPKTVMRFSSRDEYGIKIDAVKAKVRPKK